MVKEYAVYKGEEVLAIGTVYECAEKLNVQPDTIRFYTTNAYKRRIARRKRSKNCRIAVMLEDDPED